METPLQKVIKQIETLTRIRDEADAELRSIFERLSNEQKRREQIKLTTNE